LSPKGDSFGGSDGVVEEEEEARRQRRFVVAHGPTNFRLQRRSPLVGRCTERNDSDSPLQVNQAGVKCLAAQTVRFGMKY